MQRHLCESKDEPHVPRQTQRGGTRLAPAPGLRSCSHSGCRQPAECSLAHSYADRRAWIIDIEHPPDPHTYDLCAYHADRFRPPRGWSAEDLRADAGRLL